MRITNINSTFVYIDLLIKGFSGTIEVVRISQPNKKVIWKSSLGQNYNIKNSEKLEALYQEYLSEHTKQNLRRHYRRQNNYSYFRAAIQTLV